MRKPEPPLLECELREWRILHEFPDYEVSNDGRVRRLTLGSNMKAGTLLRVGMSPKGYPKYGLTSPSGERVTRNAHTLVAAEFLPPAPAPRMLVLHEDDNRLNCRDTNLKWGTHKNNTADAIRNNRLALGESHPCTVKPWTRPRGSAHSSAKLTENSVRAILADSRCAPEIAREMGVDSALIYRIKAGKIWKHITNPQYNAMLEAGRGT
jgi:HNH endonuclease